MHLPSLPGAVHLTYCTNIHAGESWPEVAASLEQTIPVIKAQLGLRTRFGIGLRLSARAAFALAEPATLQAFAAQLDRLGAYVFSINAFPYGPFHGQPVKQQVYLPDWRDVARLDYTACCAQILAQLLPPGLQGSISSVPGGWKAELQDEPTQAPMLAHLLQAAAMLARLEQQSGRRIALALEPEPGCFLETVDDSIAFFTQQLWHPVQVRQLATALDCSEQQAAHLLRRHIGVCYDVCHAAVEFEDPLPAMQRLLQHGIVIPKIQLSCALRVARMQAALVPALQRFDDGVYLHQVVVRGVDGQLQRFADLPQALAAFAAGMADGEWRVHCHVPLYWQAEEQGAAATRAGEAENGSGITPAGGVENASRARSADAAVADLASTAAELRATLRGLKSLALSDHLEVETYTWDVLPPELKTGSKAVAIARELAFVLKELEA